MLTQAKVFDPVLTRNVNGSKKFSFKLYKKYIDNITGKEVFNPFYDWLINERKVKLHHKNKWYDFVIKDIQEDSSNYVCTYQLEDAFVQELSKNGFNIVLDEELMNNSGTAEELAGVVLSSIASADTGWSVSSEKFVQTVEENLIWLKFTGTKDVYRIKDQTDFSKGLEVESTTIGKPDETIDGEIIKYTTKILGFYSSCTNKPHRFQFIYIKEDENYITNENRIIENDNCQYFMEFNPSQYTDTDKENGYFIPEGFGLTTEKENKDVGVTISENYRGRRYVFTHQSKYIPQLGRYVNEYRKQTKNNGTTNIDNDTVYYGYSETQYISPNFVLDVITNGNCESIAGWTGTRIGTKKDNEVTPSGQKASVECVVGSFEGENQKKFVEFSGEDVVSSSSIKNSTSWIRMDFSKGGIVLNSGPFDNRELIDAIQGDWVVDYEIYDKNGTAIDLQNSNLKFALQEFEYDANNDCYVELGTQREENGSNIGFSSQEAGWIKISLPNTEENSVNNENGGTTAVKHLPYFHVINRGYSREEFKKYSQARLKIYDTIKDIYYVRSLKLYKMYYDDDRNLIQPGNNANQNVISTLYHYFPKEDLKSIDNIEQLDTSYSETDLSYDTFIPYYGETIAEKIRSVKAKESNCFNILQSIAETFECWVDLVIGRNDDGSITSKTVQLKNYAGVDNYAGFRYGVNLKNMKRTFASKQIVTKLIVKDNSNEFADNGFCSITRAGSNPTGENYIYDFSYYFNNNIMDARDYIETVYVVDDAKGDDISSGTSTEGSNQKQTEWNINGYFVRINNLNKAIDQANTQLLNLSKDILKYQADLEVAVNGYEASKSSIEQVLEECERITGYGINKITEPTNLPKNVQKFVREYLTYKTTHDRYKKQKNTCEKSLSALQDQYNNLQTQVNKDVENKNQLNKLFFSTYSRFIQEGTWINEEYVDDEKYYIDALSTMYNSCYPKVAYSIDVTEVSSLPGYEFFTYELGDETFVEDYDFFGSNLRVPVVLTEIAEHLDDESKNTIKVQNFKNQFQDLFQKITATVQQTQYSTGSYEKAVALAEATQERKHQFITDALNGATARLEMAGQQTVTWGNDGITVRSDEAPCDAIRMVGGAILLSKKDKNGQQKWVTAVTADGISASLITAGIINANEISIMNGNDATFRWDSHGLSAFDYTRSANNVISGIDTHKFIRFDKYGLYGINNDGVEDVDKDGVDGANWVPEDLGNVLDKASFALTWDGLQIVNEYTKKTNLIKPQERKISLYIGKKDNNIFTICDALKKVNAEGAVSWESENIFSISNAGNLFIKGHVEATSGTIGNWTLKDSQLYGYNNYTETYVGISTSSNYYDDKLAFFAGAKDFIGTDAKFAAMTSGKVTASDLTITGGSIKISKTKTGSNFTPSFEVDQYGDVTINGGSISIGEDEDEKPNFYVDTSGNVTMKGSITLGGSITWETGTSPTQAIYNQINGPKPTDNWKYDDIPDKHPATDYSGWHKTFDSTNDKYVSYTYDGGKTWTNAIKIVGEDGKNGVNGSDASVTRGNIIAALWESKSKGDGIYPIGDLIAINATAIRTGYLGFKTSENAENDIGWIDPFLANDYNIGVNDLYKQYLKINNFSLSQYGLCIGNKLYNFEGAGKGVFIGETSTNSEEYGIILKDSNGSKTIFSASTNDDAVFAYNLTVRGDEASGQNRVTIAKNITLYGGDIYFEE